MQVQGSLPRDRSADRPKPLYIICCKCKQIKIESPCYECQAVFKTKLIDDWQERNKKLEQYYKGCQEDNK